MNVLHKTKQAAIVALLENGISQREIKRKMGIDRKTIRKYGNLLACSQEAKVLDSKSPGTATGFNDKPVQNPPGWPPAKMSQSECEPHREWIESQIRLGRNAMSIYQDLVEAFSFEHAYNSVKRFVSKIKIKDPKQFDRLEFLPGEEAQVDYGTGAMTLKPGGKNYKRPRLFVMTLRYSRRSFRKVVWKSSQETWAMLHEEAFRYFGGVPQYVVLDNLKEGVIKPDIYEPELNSLYLAVLAHYGAIADPARVCDPNRKGSVENAIKHTQDTALKGLRFDSLEDQNLRLMQWEERWAAKRVHGRTKRQVQEMFLEEKPHLKPLPLESFKYFIQEMRTVQDDGTVQIKDCYYSALPAKLHTKIIVRIYVDEIELIDPLNLELIRRHRKGTRKGMVFMDESDRIFNPSRQTRSLLIEAEHIGPNTKTLCEILFKDQGRPGQRRMRGIVQLSRKYKIAHIEEASRIALMRGIRTCRIIRKLVSDMNEKEKENYLFSSDLTQNHSLIRSSQDYKLFFETHASDNFN